MFIWIDENVSPQNPNSMNVSLNPSNTSNLLNTSKISNSTNFTPSAFIPRMIFLTYNEKILSHELFLLDYIREKQENLTGDLYFKKMEGFEDFFGGEKAEKVLILQKKNDRHASSSIFEHRGNLDPRSCVLGNDAKIQRNDTKTHELCYCETTAYKCE